MQSVSNANFGPLIAYLVPGATVLLGISPFSTTLQTWLGTSPTDAPTLGGFLYLTLASLTAGMTISAIRWAAIDTLHRYTGLSMPALDFSKLGQNVEAFSLLIEIHYRHYQFYSNMLVATAIAYLSYRVHAGLGPSLVWSDVLVLLLEVVFYATSRDTLRKYQRRTGDLLGTRQQQKRGRGR